MSTAAWARGPKRAAALAELRETARGNRLLAALPRDGYERLLPELELARPRLKEPCYEADRPIR